MALEADWQARSLELEFDGAALIGGRSCEAESGRTFRTFSPVDGRRLGAVAEGAEADVDRAVRDARRAFDSAWSRSSPAERRAILLRLAEALDAERDVLALLNTLEMGKPIADSLAEVDRAVKTFTFYAEAVDKRYGEVAPSDPGAVGMILREPVGVVGAVTPWNYPVNMPAWKLAPALAAGNCVVFKPAEQTPLCGIRIGKLALEAGLPPGVLNVVPGFGETAGAALGRHPGVDAIAFTGSTEVGKAFLRYSGESNMKPVWLECGGKSPNIVLDDVPDLEAAVTLAADGIFSNAGQSCNAGSRLLLADQIYEPFMSALVDESMRWWPSDPLDEDAVMGALVNESQRDRSLAYVRGAQDDGAELVLGGGRAREKMGGIYMEPTVLAGVEPHMRVAQEEVFGPVLSVLRIRDDAEAVAVANNCAYGLAAAVWTADLSRAHRIARSLRTGNVYINTYDCGELSMPFGGVGGSGYGVDRSLHALDKYESFKSVWMVLS